MRYSFYQLNNHSFRYTRNWYEKQLNRRIYTKSDVVWAGDSVRYEILPTIGFKTSYEFGYSLGLL